MLTVDAMRYVSLAQVVSAAQGFSSQVSLSGEIFILLRRDEVDFLLLLSQLSGRRMHLVRQSSMAAHLVLTGSIILADHTDKLLLLLQWKLLEQLFELAFTLIKSLLLYIKLVVSGPLVAPEAARIVQLHLSTTRDCIKTNLRVGSLRLGSAT